MEIHAAEAVIIEVHLRAARLVLTNCWIPHTWHANCTASLLMQFGLMSTFESIWATSVNRQVMLMVNTGHELQRGRVQFHHGE